jgi:hypothetical protein
LLSPQINGTLSPSIVNFSQLQSLSIVGTSITGTIPPAIGTMKALEMIWLDHNPNLGGPIPPSLLQLYGALLPISPLLLPSRSLATRLEHAEPWHLYGMGFGLGLKIARKECY